jgi:hypothetical protein
MTTLRVDAAVMLDSLLAHGFGVSADGMRCFRVEDVRQQQEAEPS